MAVAAGIPATFGAGVASYGKGTWQEVRQLREFNNETGTPWEALNNADRRKIDATPEIHDLITKLREDMRQYPGSDQEKAIKALELAKEDEFRANMGNLANARMDGMTWGEYNNRRSTFINSHFSIKNLAYDMRPIFDEKSAEDIEKDIRKNANPLDNSLRDYKTIRTGQTLRGDPLVDENGLVDWDATFAEAERYLQTLNVETRAYIRANENAWVEQLPANSQSIERERADLVKVLTPYWEVRGKILAALPANLRKVLGDFDRQRRREGPEWEDLQLSRDMSLANLIKRVEGRISETKERLRADPMVDRAVTTWYQRFSSLTAQE